MKDMIVRLMSTIFGLIYSFDIVSTMALYTMDEGVGNVSAIFSLF